MTDGGGVGQAVPLEVVWRVLVLSSALLLLGTFAVYSMVLVPAWGAANIRRDCCRRA